MGTDVREVTELITPGPAQALAGLPGVPGPGAELPLLWHWVYLLDSATRKQGRSGPLVFVTVRTEVSQGGQVVITEEQDLVYREAGADGPGRSGHSVAAAGRGWSLRCTRTTG